MELATAREDLDRALAGDQEALCLVVAQLTPVIQARVARTLLLWRTGPAAGRDVRQEVEDLTQEIFLLLFADGGRVLASWQPERGLSLPNFVGLVTERQVTSILRSGKRNPWKEDPTLTAELDGAADEVGPEVSAASRQEVRMLLSRLVEELSPLGRRLFDLLYLQELPPAEVMAQTGLSGDAVYAWRSRLRRLARGLWAEVSGAGGIQRTSLEEGRR